MSNSSVLTIGYCEKTNEEIKELIESGKSYKLLNLRGEYTLIYKKGEITMVVTSPVGAMQYCYYYDGKLFSHGKTIVEIIKEVGLEWKWDWESVGDLCELENLTENRTLHQSIKKVPPGSILKFDGELSIHTSKLIDSFKTEDVGNAVDAIEIFNQETSWWTSEQPYLSLSGGFDSRTILSSMLKQNIYPTLVTLGNEGSSDVSVARDIAKIYGLDHIIVSLEVGELLDNAEHIARITNGSKPACHWHTYLYPKKARVPRDQSFFVGTLGEFARSYYFDKGIAGIMIDSCGVNAQRVFWNNKLRRHRTFRESEVDELCIELREQIGREGLRKRALRNAELSGGDFLSGGSRYYLEQRVPNFYANGITMYNDTTQWRSPFHNIEWLKKIWNLSENWKLGSNWHRLAIKRNFPSLLRFAEEKGFVKGRMLTKAPPLYWTPAMQRVKYKTYDLSDNWYRQAVIKEKIMDNRALIDDLCSHSLVEKILDEHKSGKSRVRAISFLLTLIYFRKALGNG